jgi:uncharacterized protein YegP (UPF0339 family)
MTATFTLSKIGKSTYVFELKTHSGDVLMTSGLYPDKGIAIRDIDAARRLAHNDRNYEISTVGDGQSYFVVKNAKGEAIVQSEMFPDREAVLEFITQVKGKARGARLEDLTDPSIRNRAYRR